MVLVRSKSIAPAKHGTALGRAETIADIPGRLVRQVSLPSITTALNTYKTYWPAYRPRIADSFRYYNSYSYYDDYWYNKYRMTTPYWSYYRALPRRFYHVPSYCDFWSSLYDFKPTYHSYYYSPYRSYAYDLIFR